MLGGRSEEELKQVDKDAKAEVEVVVEEVKQAPFPDEKELWTDIYSAGTEPPLMRGREREEIFRF